MLESIKEEDIWFIEHLYDSLCVSETFFTNYDNLGVFEEGKLGHIRLSQISLLSQEYLIADNPKLVEKENFSLKVGAGRAYVLGGRNFGKTLCEKIDILISLMLLDGWPMGLTSYDAVHIRGVMEPILSCLEIHPIMKHFLLRKVKSPTYLVVGIYNATLEGINMNITAQTPGSQFFAKHLKKLWIEEQSFETNEVYNKRVDSRHELGCIERSSGMCNFIKNSPAGRIFYDRSLKPCVLNLPQYVNPFWDEKEKKKAAKKFGGEQSIGFRIYVKGEVVEEGLSVFDMARIRPFYKEGKVIKTVEILKSNFAYYQQLLDVIERPNNAEQVCLCADIGEAAPSELILMFKVNDIFKFSYNITLQNLKDSEQAAIFDYIINRVKVNLVGIDTTDGTGRAIFRSLEEKYPKENLVWVAFNEKISVDFAKDSRDQIIYKDGEPTYIEEYITDWSVKHLKDILYDGKIEIPEDAYKFDTQLNSVRVFLSGTRMRYELTSEEDHLFQAFQVFSIVHWMNEFNLLQPIKNKIFAKSGV